MVKEGKMSASIVNSKFSKMAFQYLLPIVVIVVVFQQTNGCGMPPAPPPAPMCCAPPPPPCPCGGRKKREAVQPHIKTKDVPCPQAEWRQLMEKSILASDANGSVQDIQSALLRRFPDEKFLVVCAVANDGADGNGKGAEFAGDTHVPNQIHLSASGDGYCNVVSERIWCQAAAVKA